MELIEGKYCIGGISITSLVEKYGSPIYLYDSQRMSMQYERLMKSFSQVKVQLNYACKALTNRTVLSWFHQMGSGLDAVSPQEVRLGLIAGFPPEKIMFTPSGVDFSEFEEALTLGVRITLDNFSVIKQFGEKYGSTVPVCIRINPHVMGGGHIKISTGHKGSKFGISVEQTHQILELVNRYNLCVEGLHMHTGSDILDPDVFLKSANALFESALLFKDLQFLDFGSGFKVSYKPGDYSTDIELLGEKISQSFQLFCAKYGKNLTLIFEPGKFLVSQAGYFAARVNVVKHTPAAVFAGVNSGLNHLIRPMFYDAYHHIVNISNPEGEKHKYNVVGYICETDTFASDRILNEIREGDILLFLNAGAYGFSMASQYNSRLRPAEILIHKGKDHLIRAAETFEDLIRNQPEVILD